MTSTAESDADDRSVEDHDLNTEAPGRKRWAPTPDVLLALGVAFIYVIGIFFLNNGPARDTQIASHGDIPTDSFVLRSVDRSIAAPGLRGKVAMTLDDAGPDGDEPSWYGRWQPVPYVAQVAAKGISGGWALGRLLSASVLVAGAAFMSVQLSRLTGSRWVGPLAMVGMLSTSVARWFADSFFTMPYDATGVALAIGIVAWALHRARSRPGEAISWLPAAALSFSALLLFQESIPALALAILIATAVLARAKCIRWIPTLVSCAVAGAAGLTVRISYHVVVYGNLEAAIDSMTSKGSQRFSSFEPPAEHAMKWAYRLVSFEPWHLLVFLAVLALAMGLLLSVSLAPPRRGRAVAITLGFAVVAAALWPTLARQHAYIHHSTQISIIAPFGALIALLSWVVADRSLHIRWGSLVRTGGAVVLSVAFLFGFFGFRIHTAPNLTADGHPRYAELTSLAAEVDQACGDTECAALIPIVPGEDNKGIYITVVRRPLISRSATLENGTLNIDVGEAPDRVVLVDVLKAERVRSDDNRQWSYVKNVWGYRLWVGSAQ